MSRRDPAAVKLGSKGGKARAANMTSEERSEAARRAGKERMSRLTPEQRSALARKAGRARKRTQQ